MDIEMLDDALPEDEVTQAVPPEQFIAFVTGSTNLAAEMDEGVLNKTARQAIDDYNMDKSSMDDWLQKMERAIDLANLVKKDKTYPFKNAANIKYPLVTSAALQFNARAYPAIVPAQAVVKVQTFGSDPQGMKAARGERVSSHMSWQLLSQIEEWEEETDSLLVQLPIVGTMIRKVWFDAVQGRPRCRLLPAGKFIVNDKVKNLSDAPRCTEEMPLYPSEITSRIRSGQFIDFDYDEGEDKQEAQEFIEHHCRLDLDEDGYDEPYIVTVHVETETVVRIVADFAEGDVKYTREMQDQVRVIDEPMMTTDPMGNVVQVMVPREATEQVEVVTGIMAINRGSYFVAYRFMPSLDGGFHGTGLGLLLGDISDTINTIMNMLLDAGHMASMGGGFIGSEFRIKGGVTRFSPGEWKTVGSTGSDIKSSLVPVTFPGPDSVLFQMLGMLIDAGKEISSTKDIMTGDNGGKVQTATTTLALIEQGMMVFSAAYKRIFRSLKKEYKLLAAINAQGVTPEEYNAFLDETDEQGQPIQHDPAKDYGAADMDIQPTADPNSVTKMQEMAKAQLLTELAEKGLIDPMKAGERVLEAAQISDREELMPKPNPEAEQFQQFQQQMTVEMMKADVSQKMVDIEKTIAEIEKMKVEASKTMADTQLDGERVRLDALSLMMKERKDELDQSLRAGLARMAAEQRDRSDQRRAQVDAAKAAASGSGGVLGGQSMAGIGAAGFGPNGGMA